MKLRLLREPSALSATIGLLLMDGRWLCWTLEDVVREVQGQPVASWKVPKATAIPFGIYAVQVTMSARFKRPLPLITPVDGFDGIRMHRGNTAADTEGCIIVGATRGPAFVGQSAPMEERLVKLLGADVHQLTIETA